jgi:opacity protein-like surface antigen
MTNTSIRLRLAASASAAAVLAAVVASSAAAAHADNPASNRADTEHAHVLRFGVLFSDPNAIDVPPLQTHLGDYRPGDYVTFGDVLTNGTGHRVGTEAGTGTITRVDQSGAQMFYTMAIHLHRGDIIAAGIASPDPHKNLVVTGGSHAFLGARGAVHVIENGDGTGSLRIVLR